MTRLRSWLNPPMVVALLALVIALGGTSYAAVQLPKNSVGSKQVKNGSVASVDVKDRTLKAADFAPGQLEPGPRGPAGPSGTPGSPAFAVITGQASLPPSNTTTSLDGRLQASSGAGVATLAPAVPTSIRNFQVELDTPPPADTSRSFQLRIDEVPTAMCSVATGATGCSASGPFAVPAGATVRLVVFSVISNGAPAGTTTARWGMTMGG